MWREPGGFGAFLTFSLVSITEHIFQPLLQAVIDEYGFLQALAQVPDLNKILFQQVGPCCIPPRHGRGRKWGRLSLMGRWGVLPRVSLQDPCPYLYFHQLPPHTWAPRKHQATSFKELLGSQSQDGPLLELHKASSQIEAEYT